MKEEKEAGLGEGGEKRKDKCKLQSHILCLSCTTCHSCFLE